MPYPRMDPEQLLQQRRGRLVTFYRNGDAHFKGLQTAVSVKLFPTFETLLVWLNEKVPTTAGVRYVFALPDAKEIKEISDFQPGRSYVASSTKRVIRVAYGDSRERFWSNKGPSAGKVRKGEQNLFIERKSQSYPGSRASSHHSTQNGLISPAGARPRVLLILSNSDRDSQQKVILNPQTTQSYEEMLADITNMLKLDFPPVKSLYTLKPPHRRVQSFSHLLRGLKNHNDFIACGREEVPQEISNSFKSPTQPKAVKARKPKKAFQPTGEPIQASPRRYEEDFPNKASNKISRTPDSPRKKDEPAVILGPPKPTQNDKTKVNSSPRKIKKKTGKDLEMTQTSRRSPPPPPRQSTDGEIHDIVMPRGPPAQARPYRKANPEVEVVQVHIHGNLREFYVPRYGQVDPDGALPDKKLKLDWVYGYRGRDARNNLHVLPSGELLYYVAAIAVVYDRRRERQVHYLGHTEDITCMAIHPMGRDPLVATGQLGGKSPDRAAHIRVWDPRSLQTMAVVGLGVFQIGVSSIGFSAETGGFDPGSLLVAVDDGDKHTLSVWDWQNSRSVAKTTTSGDTVVWGCFHPKDYTTIITFGKQHIFFWKLFWDPKKDSAGRLLRDKNSGMFETDDVPKFVTSLTFSLNGDVITGDSNGRVAVWSKDNSDAYVLNRRSSDHLRHAHTKSVFSLCILEDGTLLSGGGNEIKAWDTMSGYKSVKERTIPEGAGYIRTLVPQNFGGADGTLYIGTTNNIIYEGSMQDKFTTVVQGHHDEVWALAAHPRDYTFVSAGYDTFVYKWDARNKRLIWCSSVEKPCLSVATDPRGLLVVAGTTVGRFIVLNASTGMHMASIQAGNDQIDTLKFSPDGTLLALGSHDGLIYLYEVLDDGQVFRKYRSGTLKGHSNFVTHMDWSKDGKYLQTVSGDYDLMFWDLVDMKEVRPQLARDIEWHTETCILGYDTLGAWSNLREGEDINTVCRSERGDLLAVGDNQGALRLYKYPCTSERADYQEVKKYSGHVTNVKFTPGDAFVITSGGVDAGVLQWTIVSDLD